MIKITIRSEEKARLHVMWRATWHKQKWLVITQVVHFFNVSIKKSLTFNKRVHELAGLEFCQFEMQKKNKTCERA